MNEITIITNRVPRDVVDAWDLTEKERKEFDHLDWNALEAGEYGRSFFRYKGEVYELDDFQRVPDGLFDPGSYWDGYISDSFFSGILVKWTDDLEQIVVGRYYS